jgi:hypothetical protein
VRETGALRSLDSAQFPGELALLTDVAEAAVENTGETPPTPRTMFRGLIRTLA